LEVPFTSLLPAASVIRYSLSNSIPRGGKGIGFYVNFLLKIRLRQNVVSAPYKHPDNVFFYKFVIPHAEFVRVKGRGVLKKREESGRLYSAAGVARVDVDFCFQCKFFHIRLKAMPYPARPSPRRYRL